LKHGSIGIARTALTRASLKALLDLSQTAENAEVLAFDVHYSGERELPFFDN